MPAIAVTALSKTYRLYRRGYGRLLDALLPFYRAPYQEVQALKPLDFCIEKGETVGVVGQNGSGKSTLLQLICGTLRPSGGSIAVNGRISALLELGAGFNPEFTGKENVYLNAAILGLEKAEIDARYEEIVAFSGLDTLHLAQPVKTYSSGMFIRLAFAVAVAVEPDILIVDEALSVGDEAFQRKCFARIRSLQEKGKTILFVSHAAAMILELCECRAQAFPACCDNMGGKLLNERDIPSDSFDQPVIHPPHIRLDKGHERLKAGRGDARFGIRLYAWHCAHHGKAPWVNGDVLALCVW